MKWITVILLCSGLFHGVYGQVLDRYLKEAGESNPGVKSAYLGFEAAMQQVPQSKALADPQFSIGYFISPVETRVGPQQVRLSLSQLFPWFGTREARGDVASLMAEAKYQAFLETKNALYYQVKAAWYPLYVISEQLKWQRENLDILKTYRQLALTSFSNGRGTMTDVIRTDIMISNTETEIALMEEKIDPLEVVFNRLLNRPDSSTVMVSEAPDMLPLQEVQWEDSLIENNPKLEEIKVQKETARAQETLAVKNGMPKWGLGMDYVVVGQRKDVMIPDNGKNVFMPMVTLSLPIFRKKYKAGISQAQLTRDQLEMTEVAMENKLISSFEMARYDLNKSKQLYQLYDEQVGKTKQVIDLLYTSYRNSGRDIEEVLRMQQELIKYEIEKIKAVADYYLAMAKIEFITAN
ncbi:MAG: TolC family protein [Cyclobacteriaceae bacterium]|nr:TolC family protein [Cyclobacteriaceae bacterium]